MFTGLIKDLGKVKNMTKIPEGIEFEIETKLIGEISIDDSIAVNGVCLTATKITNNSFFAQAVNVTLEKTSLKSITQSSLVNLELALRYSDRLGGHIVQGHVNGIAEITSLKNFGENFEIWFRVPHENRKYIIKEGSIALDGISLTVADVNFENNHSEMMVTIIPHTWNHTQLHTKKVGDIVNLEVDMMAKYLENIIKYTNIAKGNI